MKLLSPYSIGLASWIGTQTLRTICGSVRYQSRYIGENCLPDAPLRTQKFIYVFWHEYMVLPAYLYANPDVHVLSSPHRDGQFMAGILKRLGYRSILGSSRRGGTGAIRRLVRLGQQSNIAITPDGPRGPRRKVKPGVIYLAARTGLPIVPLGFAYNRSWHFDSWDQLAVPRLFSKAFGVGTPPIVVPRAITKETLEPYRQEVEESLHAATDIAERWSTTGLYDTYDYDSLHRNEPMREAVPAHPR